MVYIFREITAIRNAKNLDPQRVGEIIEDLEGDDKADALWRAAKDRRHYLHSAFEWDVKRAAEAHWRDTAGQIIRCVLVVHGNDPPVPAFVSLPSRGGRHYHTPADIVGNQELQLRVMKMAHSDLSSFVRRYGSLRSICPLVEQAATTLGAEIDAMLVAMARDGPDKAAAA